MPMETRGILTKNTKGVGNPEVKRGRKKS